MQEGVADVYGQVRAKIEMSGKRMGPNDTWIAAHALLLAVLVTDDRRFHDMPDLNVENWPRNGYPDTV